jgi:organic radical activating enzyme
MAVAHVTGYLSEIFCSIQGEGIYVGERQVFVRTAGCSATCYWCDTNWSKKKRRSCVVYGAEKRSLENPLTVDATVSEVLALNGENDAVRTVSLTGGEPLEQGDFVGAVAAALRSHKWRIYLDTNGLEVAALGRLVRHVDVVAMDVKLPSATGRQLWDLHRAFLRAAAGVEVFVKVVVDHSTPVEELDDAVRLVAEIDMSIPLVFQPESSTFSKTVHGTEARKRLLALLELAQKRALDRLDDVRVIPQCHKLLKVR